MKHPLVYLLAGLVALFVQTTVFSHLPLKPDLVLVLVVCLGLSEMTYAGALLAFLLGCLMDVFAGSTFGFFALTKTAVFFFIYATRGHLFFESLLAKVGLVAACVLIEALILLSLSRIGLHSPSLPSTLDPLILGPIRAEKDRNTIMISEGQR
jgi:rod shape-determining protein MreD